MAAQIFRGFYFMTRIFYVLLSLSIILVFFSNCRNSSDFLVLTSSQIDRKNEIDTIEQWPIKKIYLIGVTVDKPFGNFDYHFSIIKRLEHGNNLVYDISPYWLHASKDFISIMKPYPNSRYG